MTKNLLTRMNMIFLYFSQTSPIKQLNLELVVEHSLVWTGAALQQAISRSVIHDKHVVKRLCKYETTEMKPYPRWFQFFKSLLSSKAKSLFGHVRLKCACH